MTLPLSIRNTILSTAVLFTFLVGSIPAADPGIPDTVEIMPAVLGKGISSPISIRLVSDNAINAMTFVITSNMTGGSLRCDSVLIADKVITSPDLRVSVIRKADKTKSADDTLATMTVTILRPIPVGANYPIYLYFTGKKAGKLAIESVSLSAQESRLLRFTSKANTSDRYNPTFKATTLIVKEIGRPPQIYLPSLKPIVANGRSELSFQVKTESYSEHPPKLRLVSFSSADEIEHTPTAKPLLTKDDNLFSWKPSPSDNGIWRATFRAEDSAGLFSLKTITIQALTDQRYLTSFTVSKISDIPSETNLLHGNLDSDPFPEIMVVTNPLKGQSYSTSHSITTSLGDRLQIDIYKNLTGPGSIAGYLNTDDHLDIASYQNNGPILLAGMEARAVKAPTDQESVGKGQCRSAVLADINNDQYLDYIMMRDNSDELFIYLGDGSQFALAQNFRAGHTVTSLFSSDFDGDHRDDLAVSTMEDLEIYLNRGEAGFMLSDSYRQPNRDRATAIIIKASDFNHDGIIDLTITSPSETSGSVLQLYLGNGDGSFVQKTVRKVKGEISGSCLGDFNSDGEIDIAYANRSSRQISLIFGNGEGTFRNELRYATGELHPYQIDCMDIDSDGDLDLAIIAGEPGESASLFLYLNRDDPNEFLPISLTVEAMENASVALLSPTGRALNEVVNSFPSGEYYRKSRDGDNNLGAFAVTNSVETGAYSLTVNPRKTLAVHEPFSLDYRIDNRSYRLAHNEPMPIYGLTYTIYPDGSSHIHPLNGEFVDDPQPLFSWFDVSTHRFQLSAERNFISLLVDDSTTGGVYTSRKILPRTDSAIYYWRVKPISSDAWSETFVFNSVALLSDNEQVESDEVIPGDFRLGQNYPNPFNPSTVIEFELARSSMVQLTVHNVLGQLITTLVNRNLPAGSHSVQWIAVDQSGRIPASGVYFYRIEAGDFVATRKMVFVQ